MEKKLIKLKINSKEEIKEMTIDEVYMQFQDYVYKVSHSWEKQYEFDDLVQIGFLGMAKAYRTYDVKKDVLFLSYSATIINNELLMYNRKNKKHNDCVSYFDLFNFNDNGDSPVAFIETIQDDTNYEDTAVNNVRCIEIQLAINKLDSKRQDIVKSIAFNEEKQADIAERLNLSQSYVSRLYKKAVKQIIGELQ
jgi:RNA polymerase sigma factor (sigma-70 family)